MLYGTAAMAGLWLATVLFVLLPFGVDLPLIWRDCWPRSFSPDAGADVDATAAGLRVIVAVLWLFRWTPSFSWQSTRSHRAPDDGLLAPQLPLAYLAACFAVARARRGDVPDWRGIFARPGQIADLLPRRRVHFSSPARAQAWFEWRRQGWRLPAWMGLLLPFELALLFAAGDDRPKLVFYTLLGVLLTPPFIAAFAAVPSARRLTMRRGR